MRSRLLVTESGLGAHQVTAHETGVPCFVSNHHDTVALRHRTIHRLPNTTCIYILCTLYIVPLYFQSVHDHFDTVRLVAIQFHARYYLLHLAVHTHMDEPFLADRLEKLLVVSFAPINERCQQQDLLAAVLTNDEVDDLLVRELNHRFAGEVRIGLSGSGIEKTQKIIHLGDRTHCRTRVLGGGLLVNGDHRTQTGYLIYVRALHVSNEPTGVR